MNALQANPILAGNVGKLRRLQETLQGVVADIYHVKKKGKPPSEEDQRQEFAEFQHFCHRWDSLQLNQDGLLTITLAATASRFERDRAACPFATRHDGDALRSPFIDRGQEEWDSVLPQVMCAFHSTPHTSTSETPNFLMLGREKRVPDHLSYRVPDPKSAVHQYVEELAGRMKAAHKILRKKQWQVHSEDSDEPSLYQVGDWVWMTGHRWRRRQSAKLQAKFVDPYCVIEALPNHTYKVERFGQISVQNEVCLKPYWASQGILPAP